jgi:KaiC/GvpD/RAD55 family RecA-like ATPase
MVRGGITVIKGEDTARTVLSLQFVYRGSTIHREYGCFISGEKTLEEVEGVMNQYGMPSECMEDSPAVVMLDMDKLGEIKLQRNGSFSHLEILVKLLKEIGKDIKFARLAVDRFDLLCEKCSKKDIKVFYNFIHENNINAILTIDLERNFNFFGECDNYIVIKKWRLINSLFLW